MIQNLNRFTFAAFGEILPERDGARIDIQEPDWAEEDAAFTGDEVWLERAQTFVQRFVAVGLVGFELAHLSIELFNLAIGARERVR